MGKRDVNLEAKWRETISTLLRGSRFPAKISLPLMDSLPQKTTPRPLRLTPPHLHAPQLSIY